MVKEFINYADIQKLPIISINGGTSTIFLEDKSIIKLYDLMFLELEKGFGMSTEKKDISFQINPRVA